jgi:Cyclic nucleotide-binding domain
MRFVQTTGGRTAIPAPRPVRRRPFIQWQAPLVWTTLSLTLHADGRAEYAVAGASRFPRHWIYGADNKLGHKSGLTDYANWVRASFGRYTPWGDEDSPALVTAVETALEHSLSVQLMHGAAKPRIIHLEPGADLVRQGDFGQDAFLILDGVIRITRDGERLAEYGPGAMLGERAALEGGTRTATLAAVTKCRVAAVPAVQLDLSDLAELATGHRREEGVRG